MENGCLYFIFSIYLFLFKLIQYKLNIEILISILKGTIKLLMNRTSIILFEYNFYAFYLLKFDII